MKTIKIILWVSVVVIIALWALLSCALKPTLETRPKLATDAIVFINGVEAPNSQEIVEALNALRANKWRRFEGKVSAGSVVLTVKSKNSDEVVRFSLYAKGIEEFRKDTYLSGGYAYGKYENLPVLDRVLQEYAKNLPRH